MSPCVHCRTPRARPEVLSRFLVDPDEVPILATAPLLGPYRIEGFVGRGGMGSVYRARHGVTGDSVALKVLPRALARDPEFLERFRREAEFLARLRHPNIVHVLDSGCGGGVSWLAMEFVEGATLRAALKKRLVPDRAIAIASKLCAALDFAHANGIVLLHVNCRLSGARARIERTDGLSAPPLERALPLSEALPLGRYRVRVEVEDRFPAASEIELTEGSAASPNLEFRPLLLRSCAVQVDRVDPLGDLDGDRESDFLAWTKSGSMSAVSGKTGRKIWDKPNLPVIQALIHASDGGAILAHENSTACRSLRTGETRWKLPFRLHPEAQTPGDLTGVGLDEFASLEDGHLRVRSVRTGDVVREIACREAPYSAECSVGDLNGNGARDLLTVRDYVLALSGRNGSPLWSTHEPYAPEVRRVGDLNGDGLTDLLVGPRYTAPRVVDGRTGRTLWKLDRLRTVLHVPEALEADGRAWLESKEAGF